MARVIAFFVKNHIFGNVLTVAVIALGIAALFLIRREVFPNVNFDIIQVSTIFPGASPEEVEKLITNPIEQDLTEIDGIKKLQSTSIEGRSSIVVFLDPDQTTAEKSKADIQEIVDRITNFPEGARKTLVTSMQSKFSPIIEVSLAGEIPEMELRALAKRIEYEVERIPGVARVVHRGLRDVEIRVEADQEKLSRLGLSLDDLILALKRQNVAIPGGTVEVPSGSKDGRELIVRTVGEFSKLDDVKDTVIRANDLGRAVRVKDVAKVSYELERASVLNRTNGLTSLNLTILKKEKADAIDLVDAVKKRLDELRPTIDPGVKIDYINDFSYFIRRRLGVLTNNLLIGLILVFALLPLVMPFRFSFLIGLGVPFAFLGAMSLLYSTGNSINLVSMMGLIIVSGILVDDSIVVTENAARLIEGGVDPKEAAVRGTREIIGALTASVFTTMAAFVPMLMMTGIFGKFIREIPVAVITALAVSLFEAMLILPSHVAYWIKPGQYIRKAVVAPKGVFRRFLHATRTGWDAFVVPAYIRLLRVVLKHRYVTIAVMAALFTGSVLLAQNKMKLILFPPEGVEIFFVRTEAPVGTSLQQNSELIRVVERAISELPKHELDAFTTSIGLVQQDPNDPNTKRGGEFAQVAVFLTPENRRDRTAAEIIDNLRGQIGLPEGLVRITFNRVNPGPPTGKPVSLGVRGKTYSDIMPAVRELKGILENESGVSDISDSYLQGKQELRVHVNPAEAAAANLGVAGIGNTVRAAYEGIVATSIREIDEEIDVRVSLSKFDRTRASSLEGILLSNPLGSLIPLSRVASVRRDQSLARYEHEANQRQISVTAEVDTKVTSPVEVNNKIRMLLPELRSKFPAVWIDFGGEDEDTKESLNSLARAFVVALITIFLILILIFRSLLQPMLVLLTVPLGVIAVIWAFFLHGMPLSFMGLLGMVALAGVIVNNAIVFVHFINRSREAGKDRWDSIFDAARTRARPIFLTTLTTVLGLFPTAYGLGGLDKFVVPIAMALAWGMLFGSFLTAFVFPTAQAIMDDLLDLIKTKTGRQQSQST